MRPEFDWYSEDSQYILSPSHLVRRKQWLVGIYSSTASGFSLSENKIMQNTRFKKKKQTNKHSRSFRTCFKVLNMFLLWKKISFLYLKTALFPIFQFFSWITSKLRWLLTSACYLNMGETSFFPRLAPFFMEIRTLLNFGLRE